MVAELRVNADGLKEFQKIVNEVAEFLEGPNQNIIGKIEKFKGRKIQLHDIE